MWRKPVGLGANRVRTVIAESVAEALEAHREAHARTPFVLSRGGCHNLRITGRLAQR